MRSLESFNTLMPSNQSSTTTTSSTIRQITETELEFKSKLFAKNLTNTIHNIANEPSIGFYRIEVSFQQQAQN
jgi:hypothetical protein